MSADRDRLQAEVRVAVLALLKQLLSECVLGMAGKGPVDE
jgi:hypothetical protein